MCLHTHHIIPVEQPVQLLPCHRDDAIQCLARPLKPGSFQGFLPQAVSVTFPVQDFHLIALAVTEHKQFFGEWIQFKRAFYQDGQTVYTLAEVNDIPAQINRRQLVRWGASFK